MKNTSCSGRELQRYIVQTMLQRRDGTVIALIYLTGKRVGAIISSRCKHVKFADRQVVQDAREVNTKFGKNMLTSWFPVGAEIEQIVVTWVEERLDGGADPDAPLFPAPPRHPLPGDETQEKETFWNTAKPVRDGFRAAGCLARPKIERDRCDLNLSGSLDPSPKVAV